MMQKIKDTNLLLKSRKRFLLIIAVVILTIAYPKIARGSCPHIFMYVGIIFMQ